MRKTIILILCMILSCGMSACQTAKPKSDYLSDSTAEQTAEEMGEATEKTAETNTTNTEEREFEVQTSAEEDEQFCIAGDEYTALGEYLHSVWEEHYGINDGINTNGSNQQVSLRVPVSKDPRYHLVRVTDNHSAIMYYFCSVDEEPCYSNLDQTKLKNTIDVIYCPLPSSYQHLVDSPEYQFDPQNGAIQVFDSWILGVNGDVFEIIFPTHYMGGYEPSLEDIYEMFEFQLVTYSPTAETNAIQ